MNTVPEPAPPVLITIEASVARIVLNRPQARNAITVALAAGLAGALREAAARARVIVIRGAGGHFCAGGDVGEVSRLRAGGPAALRPLFETFGAAYISVPYKDGFAFFVLILFLIFRPQGIFGERVAEKA